MIVTLMKPRTGLDRNNVLILGNAKEPENVLEENTIKVTDGAQVIISALNSDLSITLMKKEKLFGITEVLKIGKEFTMKRLKEKSTSLLFWTPPKLWYTMKISMESQVMRTTPLQ
tara:strand:+ start:195 stop:539 length:345 start_codon:yes stop_codon:yes gene_type:complete